jgi:hypothetical protein
MQVDPEVSKAKFDREVQRLGNQKSTLDALGIFLLGSPVYPVVDLIFIPQHPLRVLLPAKQTGSIVLPDGAMLGLEIPSLAARAFKARFDLSDYDLRAPSLEFRDPWTDDLLPYSTMFRAFEFEAQRKAHLVLLDDHPTTHRPFLCLRGIREYHEHPQHSGDDWMLYRSEMSLFSVVMSLWRASVDLVRAHVVMRENQLQITWIAEEKA